MDNTTSDIQIFGDGDLWVCINEASSDSEGWMKSTKIMEIKDYGCLVQVTTQQRNPDGSYTLAEALSFVPGVRIREDGPPCLEVLPLLRYSPIAFTR